MAFGHRYVCFTAWLNYQVFAKLRCELSYSAHYSSQNFACVSLCIKFIQPMALARSSTNYQLATVAKLFL